MTENSEAVRHSQADGPPVIVDPIERAKKEAYNALKQASLVNEIVLQHLDGQRPFKFRLSAILALHRAALEGISAYAGNFRPSSVQISGSHHAPVDAFLVPTLIEDMCDYVNDNWLNKNAIHLAAFVLWRVNWIHPFDDGNGRTARAASHLILNIHENTLFPGSPTIPELILQSRTPYYEALEKADAAGRDCVDIETHLMPLEELLADMLAKQLLSAIEKATGKISS